MDALARLLMPRSVAVIGASSDRMRVAGRPVAYLQKHGYQGKIYPVNPRSAEIAGLPCYKDIASLPEAPDVGIVMLAPEHIESAVRALAERGTGSAIVLAGGYGETGPEGLLREQALRRAAGSMRLLGPNTIGLVNLTDRITLSASGALEVDDLPAGAIALVSQSGGILGAVLSRAAARGVGFSKLVATSNEIDLKLADFIEYLATDPATQVIALYIEGIRDPHAFRRAVLTAAKTGKPVVAFKVGRSPAGARAAASHTGAMAGSDAVYDALFHQLGVIRAQTFDELIDLSAALVSPRRLRGPQVAILTSTGGAGTLLADTIGSAGLSINPPGADTAQRLRGLQNDLQIVLDRNPIDTTLAGLQPDLLRGILANLLQSQDYDAVVVIVGSSALANPDLMANAISDSLQGSDKPVLAYVSPHAPNILAALNRCGIPAFAAPEAVAAALAAMRARERLSEVVALNQPMPAQASTPAHTNLVALSAGALDEAAAKQLFAAFGITAVHERVVSSAAQAADVAREMGGKVALKMLDGAVSHKTEMGGVALGLTPDQIGAQLETMRQRLRTQHGVAAEQFVVQEMVSGVEMLIGLQRDAQLGPAIVLGMGGVFAELLNDTAIRLLPEQGGLSFEEARAMTRELRLAPMLDGYRGAARCDNDALARAIVSFSQMVSTLGERLVDAEINPLFVLPEGQGVRAADGIAVLQAACPERIG